MTEYQSIIDELIAAGNLNPDLLKEKEKLVEHSINVKGFTESFLEIFQINEEVLAETISRVYSLGRMIITPGIDTAPFNLFTEKEIFAHRVLPIFKIGLELTVAFIDPPIREIRVALQKLTGYRILPIITTASDFKKAIKIYRGSLDTLQRITPIVRLEAFDLGTKKSPKLMPGTDEPTMALFVDELLLRAAKSGASDIHVEPMEAEVLVRFRIDGILHKIISFPRDYHAGLVSVLKRKSGMDMFERQLPQDGRFTLNIADREFDIRTSCLPLVNGEKFVLRLLSKTTMMVNLDHLGFSEDNLRMIRSLFCLPNGILLVTGPTGSGKTTTLYAALNEIKGIPRNIVTVENPVEYQLPLISQVQIVPERGLTFASTLRAILRQDPNIILVGEIRDSETGEIATEAALTGHLVLSTLHTNDAIGAIPRLINLGVASFWVSASVIGIVAQRLVRRICPRCKEEYLPDRDMLILNGLENLPEGTTFFRGHGCAACNGNGYRGRIGIHEILVITEEMRDVIYGEVTTAKLRKAAIANNFRDMHFDGIQKALAGLTTIDEVSKVTRVPY
jgi:type IV pilus assembly protein PilB